MADARLSCVPPAPSLQFQPPVRPLLYPKAHLSPPLPLLQADEGFTLAVSQAEQDRRGREQRKADNKSKAVSATQVRGAEGGHIMKGQAADGLREW